MSKALASLASSSAASSLEPLQHHLQAITLVQAAQTVQHRHSHWLWVACGVGVGIGVGLSWLFRYRKSDSEHLVLRVRGKSWQDPWQWDTAVVSSSWLWAIYGVHLTRRLCVRPQRFLYTVIVYEEDRHRTLPLEIEIWVSPHLPQAQASRLHFRNFVTEMARHKWNEAEFYLVCYQSLHDCIDACFCNDPQSDHYNLDTPEFARQIATNVQPQLANFGLRLMSCQMLPTNHGVDGGQSSALAGAPRSSHRASPSSLTSTTMPSKSSSCSSLASRPAKGQDSSSVRATRSTSVTSTTEAAPGATGQKSQHKSRMATLRTAKSQISLACASTALCFG